MADDFTSNLKTKTWLRSAFTLAFLFVLLVAAKTKEPERAIAAAIALLGLSQIHLASKTPG